MTSVRPDAPQEDILSALVEQAKVLWGEERAAALTASLEQTAQQLVDVSRTLPGSEVEPGFYQ